MCRGEVTMGNGREPKHDRQWWEDHKKSMIRELARLEKMNWVKDPVVARSIFPYVLIEAINILKNSTIVDAPIDYAKTGKDVDVLLEVGKACPRCGKDSIMHEQYH